MGTGFSVIKVLPTGITANSRIIKASAYQVTCDASGLLDAAREEAERILEASREEAAALKARAYSEGVAAAQAEMAEKIISATVRANEMIKTAEKDLLGLVKLVLEKVFSDSGQESVVLGLIRSGLSDLRNERRVLVRVAPEMLEGVARSLSGVENDVAHIEYCEVVSDSHLAPDSYVLEGEEAVIKCSVADQLEKLTRLIERALCEG